MIGQVELKPCNFSRDELRLLRCKTVFMQFFAWTKYFKLEKFSFICSVAAMLTCNNKVIAFILNGYKEGMKLGSWLDWLSCWFALFYSTKVLIWTVTRKRDQAVTIFSYWYSSYILVILLHCTNIKVSDQLLEMCLRIYESRWKIY